jgi:hypothetical protein
MLESKIANFKKVISYISDAHFVKEPEIVVGPVVDVLQRFRAFGYHAYVASEGYNVLKGYFRNELYAGIQDEVLKMYPPIPTKITFKFVVKMFKQWILNINLRPDKELED